MPFTLKSLAYAAAGAGLLASLSPAALAQAVLTERQISFDAARAMATAALETCRKNGYRVSVTVVDNAGAVRAPSATTARRRTPTMPASARLTPPAPTASPRSNSPSVSAPKATDPGLP
jgi:uncharacterized protein (DUF58 family)